MRPLYEYVVILRCEAALAASLEGWPRALRSAALRGARQEVARTSRVSASALIRG
jgi:hypothetical protein